MIKNRQLANALTLSRLGNFSRAAIATNLSQPAFSRSIRGLENELGVTLFDRDGNNIIPTQYGKAMLRWAADIISNTEEMEREIQLMQGLEIGRFGVSMAQYPANLTGAKALSKMALEHPNLRFNIIQTDWQYATDFVLSREVDLGFAEISVAEGDKRLEAELVSEHKLIICCRAEHPLANRKKVTREDLDHYPLVAVPLPERLIRFPGKSHIDKESGLLIPSIDSSNLTIAKEMVTGSNAIAPMTPLQIEEELSAGKLRVLPFWEPFMHLRYGFVTLRNRLKSPAAILFMGTVREMEKEIRARNQILFEKYLPGC